MRQRVMIAMALALDPQVLIMDEPTTALDVVMQRQIVEQIAELRDRLGFSVIFITHDVSLLIEIADRIAIMYAGEIVEEAPAQDVYRRPRHPYSDALLHSFPPLRGPRRELTGIPGSPPDLAKRCRPAARSGTAARTRSTRARRSPRSSSRPRCRATTRAVGRLPAARPRGRRRRRVRAAARARGAVGPLTPRPWPRSPRGSDTAPCVEPGAGRPRLAAVPAVRRAVRGRAPAHPARRRC